MKKEIEDLKDIRLLVDSFYGLVRQDALLAPVFDEAIKDRWPQHMAKMYTFWQTLLLGERTYQGSPFAPHAALFIGKEHFERWLQLFHATVDQYFTGEVAAEASWRASRIAEVFQIRLELDQP